MTFEYDNERMLRFASFFRTTKGMTLRQKRHDPSKIRPARAEIRDVICPNLVPLGKAPDRRCKSLMMITEKCLFVVKGLYNVFINLVMTSLPVF